MYRFSLERGNLLSPVTHRRMVWPAVHLKKMHKHLPQVALHGIELGQTHVLDLLNDVFPIDTVHPLPTREAEQQVGLVLWSCKGIAVIEFVRHDQVHSGSTKVDASGQHR